MCRAESRSIVVDDVAERDETRPRDIFNTMNEHERGGDGEEEEPKQEIVE